MQSIGSRVAVSPSGSPRGLCIGAAVRECNGSPEPSDAEIDRLAAELADMARLAPLELAVAVGRVIVERVFGDVGAMRRRGEKDVSFRKLAKHPKLPWGPMWIWRAVGIYELTRRLPGTLNSKRLGASHLRAVLGLPEEVQERLLRAAEREGWSVQRLAVRAAAHRPGKGRAGRRPEPSIVKSVRSITKRTAGICVADLGSAVTGVRRSDLNWLRSSLRELREWCESVDAALAEMNPDEGAV